MKLSVREVLDLSERCFRAAGFADGAARANAESIWWTELTKGSGLTLLHELLDELQDLDRGRLARRRDGAVPVVDGAEQPSIVSGTPTLDLCCARAERRGLGLTYTTVAPGDDTVAALGHVAHAAAERGLQSVVLYANRVGDAVTITGEPARPHPLVGEADLAAPSVAHATILDAIDDGPTDHSIDLLTHALFDGDGGDDAAATADGRLVNRLLDDATTPVEGRPDVPAGFVTICFDPTHPTQPRRAERAFREGTDASTDVFRPEQIGTRADRLLREGVDIERSVWEDIFEYSSDVLAPEFEGSYRGAGFEINE
jgi:LDH2 family malate/lactate/ureidoglycolate dehydrogenase